VGQTTALAGATTESLRNIELVKSLGLTAGSKSFKQKHFQNSGTGIDKSQENKKYQLHSRHICKHASSNYIIIADDFCVSQRDGCRPDCYHANIFFLCIWTLQEIGNIILSYREAQASLKLWQPDEETTGTTSQ
jgi:ATP-binding cassette subfamily B protein